MNIFPYSVINKRVIEPMLLATSGTIEALQVAFEKKDIVVNLGGGFHHANYDSGEGFCLFPDVPIAIEELHKKHGPLKIAVIDCDAHQGNGVQRCIKYNKNVLLVDMYDFSIYPSDEEAKNYIDIMYEMKCIKDEEYLKALENILNDVKKFNPEVIIFIAGTDIYKKDPLSTLKISKKGIIKRDNIIVSFSKNNNIPLLWLLAGGYHPDSADIISDSIINNLT